MQKAIITGANGFIGSNVIKELVNHSINVIAIHREGHGENIPDSPLITKIALDVGDIEQLINDKIKADVFFHFAWDGVAGMSRADPNKQMDNVKMMLSCLHTAKKAGCKRFINASSIIEDEAFAVCTSQDAKPGIAYLYGTAKQAANHIAKMTAAEIGIDYLSGKISNSYGVGEISPRLLNTAMRRILNREPLRFTEGKQNYDFIYITDVAVAFRLIAEKGYPFHEYMIGSGTPKSLREYLQEMLDILAPGYPVDFGAVPFTGKGLPTEIYDTGLIKEHCEFVPRVSFQEGVKLLFSWLSTHTHTHTHTHMGDNVRASGSTANKQFSLTEAEPEGLVSVQPFISYDNRGSFIKDFSSKLFADNGIDYTINEVFYSESKPGVIRGLHFQHTKWQAKIVRCVKGKIYDVVVDIRKNSPTFGKWQGYILSEYNNIALLIPEGYAHGFLAIETSVVSYKCNMCFIPEYDSGIRYDDETLGIDWQKYWNSDFIVSEKDLSLMSFNEYRENYI